MYFSPLLGYTIKGILLSPLFLLMPLISFVTILGPKQLTPTATNCSGLLSQHLVATFWKLSPCAILWSSCKLFYFILSNLTENCENFIFRSYFATEREPRFDMWKLLNQFNQHFRFFLTRYCFQSKQINSCVYQGSYPWSVPFSHHLNNILDYVKMFSNNFFFRKKMRTIFR